MKKFLTIIAIVLIASATMCARDRVTRNVSELPATSQTFLKKYFPKTGVNHIKIEKELFKTSYDVILNNGTEIEFDSDGNWKEIDCGNTAIPNGIIMKAITNYVKTNYPKRVIVQIERSSSKYEVELSDGTDLDFGRNGEFLRVDD